MKVLLFWLAGWFAQSSAGFNHTPAQFSTLSGDPDSLVTAVNYEANVITAPAALAGFITKLRELEAGQRSQVRILHIGDSHIQADILTGEMRRLLQERFGNAGRGLVFPYRQAGTHGPRDLRTSSNVTWTGRIRTFQQGSPPVGISGMGIRTALPGATLTFSLIGPNAADNAFDQVTIFRGLGPAEDDWEAEIPVFPANPSAPIIALKPQWITHRVQPGETLYGLSKRYGCTVAALQAGNALAGTLISVGQLLQIPQPAGPAMAPAVETSFRNQGRIIGSGTAGAQVLQLTEPSLSIRFRNSTRIAPQGQSTLYGVSLENSQKTGILYHMAGVNGTTFYHFNRGEYFLDQIPDLAPDLIIISLGTNESVQQNLKTEDFAAEVSQFLQRLRTAAPEADLLMTTNPDVLLQRKYDNPKGAALREVLLEQCVSGEVAGWDLYGVMGGLGSIRQWRKQQLAYIDYIHFTEAGYKLQASLLFQALMQVYATY